MQFTKELTRTIQITVYNQGIDFRFCEPRQGSLRFALDGDVHVKAAEDARHAAEAQKPPRTGNTKKPKPTKAHITPRKEKLSSTRAAP